MSKKKNRKLNPTSPLPMSEFHIYHYNFFFKKAIVLIMTVSTSFIYTGVNFNTQPKLHENYGRQSIYKQFTPALHRARSFLSRSGSARPPLAPSVQPGLQGTAGTPQPRVGYLRQRRVLVRCAADTGQSQRPLESFCENQETSWLFFQTKTLPMRDSPTLSPDSSFQNNVPRGTKLVRWVTRLSLGTPLTASRQLHHGRLGDCSLHLYYSPPIEKVIKNNLGITCLIGLQPSNHTKTVTETQLC